MKCLIVAAAIATFATAAGPRAGAAEPAGKPSAAQPVAKENAAPQRDFPLAAKRARSPGEAVYLAKCQYCHLQMGPGTITLAKRLGPERALLADRTDLTADYVKAVVRHGLNTMPPINRVEVSDAELDQIAAFLTRARPVGGPPAGPDPPHVL